MMVVVVVVMVRRRMEDGGDGEEEEDGGDGEEDEDGGDGEEDEDGGDGQQEDGGWPWLHLAGVVQPAMDERAVVRVEPAGTGILAPEIQWHESRNFSVTTWQNIIFPRSLNAKNH